VADEAKRVKASARVMVQVEIDLPAQWGPDCPISQVHDQASRQALECVEKGLVFAPHYTGIGRDRKTPAKLLSVNVVGILTNKGER